MSNDLIFYLVDDLSTYGLSEAQPLFALARVVEAWGA